MRIIVATLATVLLAAAPANAAVRFAAVGGGTTEPCNPAPCLITQAIQSAHTGDEVVIAPGSYPVGAAVMGTGATANLNIHGQAGAPRPIITTTGGGSVLIVGGDNNTVRHLDLRQGVGTGTDTVALQLGRGATVDDVAISDAGAPSSFGINLSGSATIRDTTVLVRGDHSIAIGGVQTGPAGLVPSTLVHDTVYAPGAGSVGIRADALCMPVPACSVSAGASVLTLRDVLVRGGTGVGAADLQAVASSSEHGTIDVQYSDYATVAVPTNLVTAANNTAAAPLLADPVTGDFHELAGSPTIDAGQPQSGDDATDPDGRPRTVGAATDIGAYEAPFPAITASAVLPTGFTTATVAATVDGLGQPTTVSVQYGTTAAYGASTVPVAIATNGPQNVTIPLTGLTPGLVYHLRIAATQAFGTATCADIVVTMPVAAQSVVLITSFKVSPSRFRVAPLGATKAKARKKKPKTPLGTTFTIGVNLATTVKISISHRFSGLRVGASCVKRSSRHRHGKACAKTITDGVITAKRPAGTSRLVFTGRIAGRALKPGAYLATLSPAGGGKGSRSARFTIVSR